MDERDLMGIIESILFVSGDPVSARDISQILELDIRKVRKLIKKMIDCFHFERRGLQIIMVNDTYQLATRPEYRQYIEKYIGKNTPNLTQASLETLAILHTNSLLLKQKLKQSEV